MATTSYKHALEIAEHQHMVRITRLVRQDVSDSRITNGIAVVYCPHTTAGISVNENADPDVVRDIIYGLERSFPSTNRNYRHAEGNSHAHLKSVVCGASQTFIIEDGQLVLGRWQDIYFCEFDGPRQRTFYVKLMEG